MIGNFTHSKQWAIFGSVAVHMVAVAVAWWAVDQVAVTDSSAGAISVRLITVQDEPKEGVDNNSPSSLASVLSGVMPVHKRLNPHPKAPLLLATSSARQIKAPVIEQAQTTQTTLKAKPGPTKVAVNPKPVNVLLAAKSKQAPSKKLKEQKLVKAQIAPRMTSLTASTDKPKVKVTKAPKEEVKQPIVTAIAKKAASTVQLKAHGASPANSAHSTTPNGVTRAQGMGSSDKGVSINFDAADIKIKKMTPPKYPYYAILQRKSGTAVVAIELHAKGTVKTSKLHLSSEHKILDKAVLHAARKWQFVPPVPSGKVLVPVKFELECAINGCKPKQVEQG